jgi:hypothetical protein
VRGDVSVDSEMLLLTDFVNLKIKSTQSFKNVHRGRICVCMFIGVSDHIYIYIHINICVSKKIRAVYLSDNCHFSANSTSGPD